MNIKNEVLIRVYIVLSLIVIAAIVIFSKAVYIQVAEGDKWRARGDSLYVDLRPVSAERGNIMTEDGSLLATSLPFFEIRMDLKSTAMTDEVFLKNLDSLSYCLATYVMTDYTPGGMRQHLIDERANGQRYMLVKKNVSFIELERIRKFPLFNLGRYRGGFIVKRESKRDRPFKLLARRTIGYVREDAKPVGLEGYFDKELGGKAGKQLMQRIRNTWIPVNDLTAVEPKNGDDLVTTIDINLQDIAEEALLRGLKYHNADHGTAVVMEVHTGAIKAIANIGKTQSGWWETYNHAIGDAVEPGSTFKLATMLALLDDEHISLNDSIDLEQGKAEFYEEEMLDATYHQLDSTTIRKAFEISSNVGMAKLVQKYYKKNPEKWIEKMKSMNLHLPTGIEIEGEGAPYIKEAGSEADQWSGTTLPWMSIGYELEITALQLLNLYNSVANGGVMMKPYLVSEIQHFGETVKKFKPTVIKRKIASKSAIAKVHELLLGVVENGTARKLKTNKYQFAGKTGTAQIDYRKFKPRANIKHRASFAGYYPAQDPIYSCIVMVTNPRQGGIYGGEVAGPIFREIADKSFLTRIELHDPINKAPKPVLAKKQMPGTNVGYRTDMKKALKFLEMPYREYAEDWAVTRVETDTISLLNRTIRDNEVPNVVNMGLRDALFVLENRGLKVVTSGVGKVVRQSIIPGTRIKGQTMKLTLN